MYMLDTNILSDVVRQPRGAAAKRIRQVGQSRILLSIFTVAEARAGVLKLGSDRLGTQLEQIAAKFAIAPFEQPGDLVYAEIRTELERRGKPIGANDTWIAAHALALDCVLVTANEDEFGRVPRLRVENWLKPADI